MVCQTCKSERITVEVCRIGGGPEQMLCGLCVEDHYHKIKPQNQRQYNGNRAPKDGVVWTEVSGGKA